MNKKQYMMMAAFLCVTTTSMAAPVNVTAEQSYDSKILQSEGHAPLETSASVVSSDKEYRLRQGLYNKQILVHVMVTILCILCVLTDMYHSLWWDQ